MPRRRKKKAASSRDERTTRRRPSAQTRRLETRPARSDVERAFRMAIRREPPNASAPSDDDELAARAWERPAKGICQRRGGDARGRCVIARLVRGSRGDARAALRRSKARLASRAPRDRREKGDEKTNDHRVRWKRIVARVTTPPRGVSAARGRPAARDRATPRRFRRAGIGAARARRADSARDARAWCPVGPKHNAWLLERSRHGARATWVFAVAGHRGGVERARRAI